MAQFVLITVLWPFAMTTRLKRRQVKLGKGELGIADLAQRVGGVED